MAGKIQTPQSRWAAKPIKSAPLKNKKNGSGRWRDYKQIYIQVVFAVEARQYVIRPDFKEEVHKYITGVISKRQHKLLAVHCMPDRTHLLIGVKSSMALSDLVRDIKNASSRAIA